MNKKINLCNIYIWLWLLGFVQKLFITSSFVSLLFSIPSMFITLYCFVKVFKQYRPKGALLVLCIFFVILVCYGFGLVLLNDAMRGNVKVDNNSFLLMVLVSLGPIISFYYFSKQGLLNEKKLAVWFFVFLVVVIIHYYDSERRAMASLMERGINYKYEDITNNASYTVLGLFPFLFVLRKKTFIQYTSLVVLFYFIISGMKRGAMLVSAVLLVWFVLVSVRTTSNKRKWFVVVLTVFLIIIGWRYLIHFYENNDYFQYRVESTMEGRSSSRNIIYSTLWQHYVNNDNMLQLIFGEGAYHTFNIAGNDAHNDWLELLIDCGLITTLIYLVYWVCFFHDWRRSKQNLLIYAMLGACFIFTFLRTFFSMSFSDMPFCMSMVMGYCFAQIEQSVTQ